MSKKQDSSDAGRRGGAEEAHGSAGPTAPPVPAPSAASAVGELMAERRRFEEWLAALDARREATPPRVFARVHADYTSRLEAVVRKLTEHTDGLRAELASLTSRLAELTDEQQQARDERAESELRAHVGELSAAEWEATARAADERIDALVSRRADVETELQRARELLAEAERPATPHLSSPAVPSTRASVDASVTASVNAAAAAVTPESTAAVADSAEAGLHVPSAAATGADAAEVPPEVSPAMLAAESRLMDARGEATQPDRGSSARGRASSFDELAFLNSVVDTPEGTGTGTGAGAPADRLPSPRPRPAPPAAPASVPKPSSGPARRDSMALRSTDEPIENLDATADRSILGTSGRKGTPMAANVTGNHPIVLKDKAHENARTLKCAECGALNFPTEWYCERCGGELASL